MTKKNKTNESKKEIIQAKNLSKSFGKIKAVNNISFSVKEGYIGSVKIWLDIFSVTSSLHLYPIFL